MATLKDDFPTEDELRRRRGLFEELQKIRAERSPEDRPFPCAEAMIREDRDR